MSQEFTIVIEETIVGEFKLEANSCQEAFEKAEKMYKQGILLNEPGECQDTQIRILDADGNVKIDFSKI